MDAFISRDLPIYVRFTKGFEIFYNYREQFIAMFPQLENYPKLSLEYQRNADHLFSTLDSRNEFRNDVLNWIEKYYLISLEKNSPIDIDLSKDRYLHDILLDVCAINPKKVAIYTEKESCSYEKLALRSKSIAAKLLEMGVKEGDSVAVCCERSPDMIAAMLGILIVGANYIPMDPSFPKDRLAMMVEDTGLKIVLSDLKDKSIVPDVDHLVDLPSLDHRELIKPVLKSKTSDLLAYMIFTSGSTGRPKGVMVQHLAMQNFLHSVKKEISSIRMKNY